MTARVLLFTGKGGVGKTTVAAATAVRCADRGLRTLVLSTDPAHSLADAFARPVGPGPTQVEAGLWVEQLDPRVHLDDAWSELRSWLVDLARWAGLDGIGAEELLGLPGLDELLALADIGDRAADARFDAVVVDCAPTAETLRLLFLPDVVDWWMHRVAPFGRRATRLLAPVVRSLSGVPLVGGLSGVPLADDAVFSAGERFAARLAGVKELLADATRTWVRLVVTAEQLVIAEARRTATALALYGYGVDGVVVNRLLPDEVVDPWFAGWKEVQAEHLRTVEEGFAPLPVRRVGLAPAEVVGLDALRRLGEELHGDTDPTAAQHEGRVLTIERCAGGYELGLALPFVERDELDLARRGDELLVRVGDQRRRLLLPDSLARRTVAGASLRQGRLVVRFEDPPAP